MRGRRSSSHIPPAPPSSPPRYAARINGLTHINLTKLDVLDGLDEIKVGVGYRTPAGPLDTFPADLASLERAEVVYETFPGWKQDISKIRSWEDMPENAKKCARMGCMAGLLEGILWRRRETGRAAPWRESALGPCAHLAASPSLPTDRSLHFPPPPNPQVRALH